MTVYDVLDQLRESSLSKVEQGARFERLMKAFLTTDPVYADQFSQVWLWPEWPGNGGKHDTGIDLVAQDRLTGGLVAIQCKFYARPRRSARPTSTHSCPSPARRASLERVIVSTTDKWNAHAEKAIGGPADAGPSDWACPTSKPARSTGDSSRSRRPRSWSTGRKYAEAAPDGRDCCGDGEVRRARPGQADHGLRYR